MQLVGVSQPGAIKGASQDVVVPEQPWRRATYWPFVMPALIVVLSVIIFPWLFTIWMSFQEWKVGSPTTFVGFANYLRLPADPSWMTAGHANSSRPGCHRGVSAKTATANSSI